MERQNPPVNNFMFSLLINIRAELLVGIKYYVYIS